MTGRPSPDHTNLDHRLPARRTDQRGAVLPSPVVLLSIVAVALAAVAFVTTRDADPREREIIPAASSDESPGATAADDGDDAESDESDESGEGEDPGAAEGSDGATESASPADPTTSTTPEPPKKTKPPVVRSEVGVVVFNNTSISGLAGETLARVQEIGWNGVAADNWYGTIPATTVYFPPGKRPAAQKLALDLGIQRVIAADPAMSDTNLTVILTGPLG